MKCEIIRDLLPSYIDNLVSEESREEVDKHLLNCSECAGIYEDMKKDTEEDIVKNKIAFNPFKKLSKKVVKAIIITICVCLILAIPFYYFFVGGWSIKSEDIDVDYSYDQEFILFNFKTTEGVCLEVHNTMKDEENSNILELDVKGTYKLPYDDRGKTPNEFLYGVSFEPDSYYEKDVVKIHYADKTETINLSDLAKKLNVSD
ncbi:MAG: zf-HC2 domain-containing protein [Acutalibacteraceae bacterium]